MSVSYSVKDKETSKHGVKNVLEIFPRHFFFVRFPQDLLCMQRTKAEEAHFVAKKIRLKTRLTRPIIHASSSRHVFSGGNLQNSARKFYLFSFSILGKFSIRKKFRSFGLMQSPFRSGVQMVPRLEILEEIAVLSFNFSMCGVFFCQTEEVLWTFEYREKLLPAIGKYPKKTSNKTLEN